jgi:hypothetical protein
VKELGADVNQADNDGTTPLFIAAEVGSLDVVSCLVKELGADVNQADNDGNTPLFTAARQGKLGVVHWLLVEGGASVDDMHGPQSQTLWNVLKLEDAVDADLTSLLQTMVLLSDAPPDFIAKLSPHRADLCLRGRRLRTQLPAYRVQQRTSIVTECPLPEVLQSIVTAYAAPTSEDMWTYRTYCANPSCDSAGLKKCANCLEVYFCTKECQVTHWPAHKADCKRRVEAKASKMT